MNNFRIYSFLIKFINLFIILELTAKEKLRQEIAKDPFKHTGETLLDIDCSNIKNKKKVYILKGNTHAMIIKYFESRCDYEIMPAKER